MFAAIFTLIGRSGAYVSKTGLHPPRGIHGRGAGAFRCQDGRFVQFDSSSARHLVWFAQAAGITDWGPDYLDIMRLRDETANERPHARLRELFLTRGQPSGGSSAIRRAPRSKGTDDRRVDRHPACARDRGRGAARGSGAPAHIDGRSACESMTKRGR
jgi:hypothetical protein